jgi:hypothetical protein
MAVQRVLALVGIAGAIVVLVTMASTPASGGSRCMPIEVIAGVPGGEASVVAIARDGRGAHLPGGVGRSAGRPPGITR